MASSGTASSISYRAAVAEHKTLGKTTTIGDVKEAMEVVKENLERYDLIAAEVKADHGAQIVVFPEWGLFGTCPPSFSGNVPASSRDRIRPFCQSIGSVGESLIVSTSTNVETNKDDDDDANNIAMKLAKIAVKHSIVIVANVAELIIDDKNNDEKIYNTEIAIDENGVLLAKYHKMNPFYKKTFDKPTTPTESNISTFQTSFGITFGLMVCYDIFQDQPQSTLLKEKNITQFPYSVAIPSFGTSWYLQRWAKNNNAILLSSNLGGGNPNDIFSPPTASSYNVKDVSKKKGFYTVATINILTK